MTRAPIDPEAEQRGVPTPAPVPRRLRLAACLRDLGVLAAGLSAAALTAFAFLLARTAAGRFDAGAGDTALAAALMLAVPPTWVGWLAISIGRHGVTPGQHRAGLVRRTTHPCSLPRVRRLLGAALHPLTVPVWLWLCAMLALLAVPALPWLVLAWSGIVSVGAVGSLALLLSGWRSATIHDQVSCTRLRISV